jgi:hypothetical protein
METFNITYPPAVAGVAQEITRISGSSGAAGADITYQTLTANSADNTTVTLAIVMTTTGLAAGTWRYRYVGNYQTAALTTGISMVTNFSGTVTTGRYAKRWTHVTTGAAASTGVGDDIAGTLTGQIVEGHSHITNNTDEGPTAGVATINANIGFVLEGFATTTTSGNLEFKMRSEVAASAVRIIAGTSLVLEKIA